MTIVIGLLFLAVGLALSAGSAVRETRAAGRQRVPLWNADRDAPRGRLSVRVIAVALAVAGAILLLLAWDPAALVLVIAVFVPQAVVIALHNRRVRTWQLAKRR